MEPATGAEAHIVPEVRTPRFVGRAAQLVRLIAAFADPATVVLIEGEAGIGKRAASSRRRCGPPVSPGTIR